MKVITKMNQRIRQLAEQAVNSIPDHVDFDIPNVFKQKFAELIVKECLLYAKDGDIDFMKFMIKKHFGIEE